MKELDTIFVKNLRAILENRNMKISHIEKAVSHKVGYFADSKAKGRNISLETALKISKLLDVSIEDLCNENFYKKIELDTIDREIKELEERKKVLVAKENREIKELEKRKLVLKNDKDVENEKKQNSA